MKPNAPTRRPLERILRPKTIREIGKLPPHVERLAQRWAQQWPEETRDLESSGKLLAVLEQKAEEEALLQWRGRVRGKLRASPDGETTPLPEFAPPPPAP
jgi:hypothetical protein